MKRILFLDDSQIRHDYMKARVEPILGNQAIVDYVYDAASCIRAIFSNVHYDLVMLDHDLGGSFGESTDGENTGSEVARVIAANRCQIGKVMIHSINGPGRDNMKALIEEVGIPVVCRPFFI